MRRGKALVQAVLPDRPYVHLRGGKQQSRGSLVIRLVIIARTTTTAARQGSALARLARHRILAVLYASNTSRPAARHCPSPTGTERRSSLLDPDC